MKNSVSELMRAMPLALVGLISLVVSLTALLAAQKDLNLQA
jgi:hypothetical protein